MSGRELSGVGGMSGYHFCVPAESWIILLFILLPSMQNCLFLGMNGVSSTFQTYLYM